jgi:hypothetical protein
MFRKALSLLKVSAVLAATTVAMLQLHGCSGSGGSGGSSNSPTTGTLKVALTDKASHDFAEVWIKVKTVSIVPVGYDQDCADNDPKLINIPLDPNLAPYSFNVLNLAYIQQLLGSAILPAGNYSQVRLILESNVAGEIPVNYVILQGDTTGTKIPLKTPSAQHSGLKVVGKFIVEPGVINAIALDFDPNTAIVKRGNGRQTEPFILKPTGIRIIQMADILPSYGSIFGNVAPSSWTTATLTVVPRGQTSPVAAGTLFSSYTTAGLVPFTSNVPPNTYRVHIRSDGFLPYSSPLTTVYVKEDYDLGTITLRPSP